MDQKHLEMLTVSLTSENPWFDFAAVGSFGCRRSVLVATSGCGCNEAGSSKLLLP